MVLVLGLHWEAVHYLIPKCVLLGTKQGPIHLLTTFWKRIMTWEVSTPFRDGKQAHANAQTCTKSHCQWTVKPKSEDRPSVSRPCSDSPTSSGLSYFLAFTLTTPICSAVKAARIILTYSLLYARYCSKSFIDITAFNFHPNSRKLIYYYLHFKDKETEAQRGWLTFPG